MKRLLAFFAVCSLLLVSASVHANIFGSVRGVVHDAHHRPVQGATVVIKAAASEWNKSLTTDASGEFQVTALPLGDYSVTVKNDGFAESAQDVTVVSGSEPVLHFQLEVAAKNEKVTVSAELEVAPTDNVTPITLVNRLDIVRTPGASRSNSMSMITNYVPGSYVTHDMLHIRGGHQTTWLVDGVPIPNTNIASNIGPQIDPKDIDYMEANRGSYGAEFGDRTYGIFNIVPRTGFERNNEAELVLSAGNFHQTNDQFNLGGHTQRFAYYAIYQWQSNRSRLTAARPASRA